MKQKTLISIAMATYNGEQFLKEQLDSIFKQTYKNFELIICDDCSTDKTIDILNTYAKKYPQIKIIRNERNIGYLKNFEKAVSLTTGNYIAFTDQDDIWETNKLEELLLAIENYSLAFSDAALIDDNGNSIHPSYISYAKRKVEYLDLKYFLFRNTSLGCTLMVTRKLIDYATPFPPTRDIFPHDWWLAIAATCQDGIKYVNKPLINYRQHTNNVTGAGARETHKLPTKSIFHNSTRRKVFECRRNRVEYILNSNLKLTNQDEKFLKDWLKLLDNKLNPIQSLLLEIEVYLTMRKLRK